jgi:hypothetical protein
MRTCPKEQSDVFLKTSLLTLLTTVAAAWKGDMKGALCSLAIVGTSLNYWRYPVYGFRRNMDIATVSSCSVLNTYTSFYSENQLYFLILTQAAIMCYVVNRYYQTIILHCMVHILGNMANVIMYRKINFVKLNG